MFNTMSLLIDRRLMFNTMSLIDRRLTREHFTGGIVHICRRIVCVCALRRNIGVVNQGMPKSINSVLDLINFIWLFIGNKFPAVIALYSY